MGDLTRSGEDRNILIWQSLVPERGTRLCSRLPEKHPLSVRKGILQHLNVDGIGIGEKAFQLLFPLRAANAQGNLFGEMPWGNAQVHVAT